MSRVSGWLIAAVAAVLVACDPAPTPSPTAPAAVSLAPIEVTSVGEVRQGTTSTDDLLIRVTEVENDSILPGTGAFELVLTDSAGGEDAVVFTGTPSVTAPGSLGATASLTRSNVLTVQIVYSDSFNIEQMTIGGLRLSASASAPVGALDLTIGGCTAAFAGCAASNVLASPGSVVAAS